MHRERTNGGKGGRQWMTKGINRREHRGKGGRGRYQELVKGLKNGLSCENSKGSGEFAMMVGWSARRQGGRKGERGGG